MKKKILFSLFLLVFLAPTAPAQNIGSPVIDISNNVVGGILKFVADASETIRRTMMPLKRAIGTIQGFFQKAKIVVNAVVKNLRMVKQLIQLEQKMDALFDRSIQQISSADNLTEKWKHLWILTNLYYEAINLSDLFTLAISNGKSALDDEQRLLIIREARDKMRVVYRALKAAVRRVNKQIYQIERSKREVETFQAFFS